MRFPCAAHEKPFYFRTEHTSCLRSLKKTLKRKHTKIIDEDFWSVWKCKAFCSPKRLKWPIWVDDKSCVHLPELRSNVAPFTGGFSLSKYSKLCCIPCPMVCTCPTYHFFCEPCILHTRHWKSRPRGNQHPNWLTSYFQGFLLTLATFPPLKVSRLWWRFRNRHSHSRSGSLHHAAGHWWSSPLLQQT